MHSTPSSPDSASRASASARLNAWAAETLARVTTNEPDKKAQYEAQISEDGNHFLAWALLMIFPCIACLAIAVANKFAGAGFFWIPALIFAAAVFFNLTQTLWAKRRRAALDSKISLEILTALEIQRRNQDEILRRLKALEEKDRPRGFPDISV